MKIYQYILFDLDGTITDSGPGIMNAVRYAMDHYKLKLSDAELRAFIGPPLYESFAKHGIEDTESAIQIFREYYKEKGIFENVVYPGLEDLLIQLKNSGKTLIVATSKPEVFAKQVLAHFKLDGYFTVIAGATLDATRTQKTHVIDYALKTSGITTKADVLMIGDREHDIHGAHANGLDGLGVLYGYGNRQELEGAHAEYIVETLSDLMHFFKESS